MPIKFRCDHCRQFLGISHSKAGMLVDCPTCGRTIRVPDPEGKRLPLPDLKLNLKDSKLANALDELARLSEARPGPNEPESAVAVVEGDDAAARNVAAPLPPQVIPAPIPVEPLVVAKPIPLQTHDARQPAAVASMQELAALASIPAVRDPAAEQPVVDVEMALPVRQVIGRSTWSWNVVSWIVVASWLGFIAGFLIGRGDRSAMQTAKDAEPAKGHPAANGAARNDPFADGSKAVAVRGRITFVTEAGDRRPDRGARVLLLPEQRSGTAKLPVTGFRPADSEADGQIAAAALRALGGDVAIVDEAGDFAAAALKPGTYRVLALSHFQPRDDRSPMDASLKALLESFFDKPEQLLGKCRYHLDDLKVSGQEPALWDFSFERD